MTNYVRYTYVLITLLISGAFFAVYNLRSQKPPIADYLLIDRQANIHPDYKDIVIPPNIAGLNFLVEEEGKAYFVKIHAEQGGQIEVFSKSGKIEIPGRQWRALLAQNVGGKINLDIFVKQADDKWHLYSTIHNKVASEEIDGYLVYRKIRICALWKYMGIYQRNLENYAETSVLHNRSFAEGCVHCHRFNQNDPGSMVLQIRSQKYGNPMLVTQNEKAIPIKTQTQYTPGNAGFTAWHPSGRVIAFTLNKFEMLYHTAGDECREVFDQACDIALYHFDANSVSSIGHITDPNAIESFPEWSPDGKYLYFCRAQQVTAKAYDEMRCDLMRIAYELDSQSWGELETVISADAVNGSITKPRFSPDGRFILFNVSDYGDFPIHQVDCDLYMYEVESGKHWELPISSSYPDTWHSWSGNGRWIAFASKRPTGRFARIYLSYVDNAGTAHKPFILPHKDPAYYDSLLQVYNMPELVDKPISVSSQELANAVKAYEKLAPPSVVTGASPQAKSVDQVQQADDKTPWQQAE